jgi:hypothetical protein
VVPIENETTLTEAGLKKQFARTPYAVSFESQGVTFTFSWVRQASRRQPDDLEGRMTRAQLDTLHRDLKFACPELDAILEGGIPGLDPGNPGPSAGPLPWPIPDPYPKPPSWFGRFMGWIKGLFTTS